MHPNKCSLLEGTSVRQPSSTQKKPPRRAKILNVDDNTLHRTATSEVLRHAGYDVVEAKTGDEGLRMARENPDLILLDVNLPDISGMEVCRQLKSQTQTEHIPVLHISGTFFSEEAVRQGIHNGADGYLRHPVESEQLIHMVNNFVQRRPHYER
jgi:DNA-binding response OmpR family regulator